MAYLIAILLIVVPLWRICDRTGHWPALSLVAGIPVIGLLIVAGILAFSEWPAANSTALDQGD